MSCLRKLILLLLVSACAAQTTHTYPALDTNNVFTGLNTFNNMLTALTSLINNPTVDNPLGYAAGQTIHIGSCLFNNPIAHNPVGQYTCIQSESVNKYPIWAYNPLISIASGADTEGVGIEVDVNNNGTDVSNPFGSIRKLGQMTICGYANPCTTAHEIGSGHLGGIWHNPFAIEQFEDSLFEFLPVTHHITQSITGSGSPQTVTIASGSWPLIGEWISLDTGGSQENVQITAVTDTSITGVFTKNHSSLFATVYAGQYGIDFRKTAFVYSPLILGDLQWSAAANAPNPPNISLVDNGGTIRIAQWWDYPGVVHYKSLATSGTGWNWQDSTGATLANLQDDSGNLSLVKSGSTFTTPSGVFVGSSGNFGFYPLAGCNLYSFEAFGYLSVCPSTHIFNLQISNGTSSVSALSASTSAVNIQLPLQVNGVGVIDASQNGTFASVKIGGTNTAPVVATPTVGQAACIYAAGPPVQIGKCTTVVSSTGACTCAP